MFKLFRSSLIAGSVAAAFFARTPMLVAEASKVSPGDQLQHQQKNVAAQMQELTERMYRLGELTREAEPDDSARLLLAVRKARESLIIEQMKEILGQLSGQDLTRATEEQKQVIAKLGELKQLLLNVDLDLRARIEQMKKLQAAIAKLDAAIKDEQRQHDRAGQLAELQKKGTADLKSISALQQEQQKNRSSTDAVAKAAREFGQPGAKAATALGGACQAMSGAEASLGGAKPGDAQGQQKQAVDEMRKARAELERERQRLAAEIEKLVKAQVMENLRAMLEQQKSVREATQSLSSRAASGERQAILRVRQLSPAEQRVVDIAAQTIELIEQTRFSVALPPAVHAIQRRCVFIAADLGNGQAGEKVVASEIRVEKDIQELLETFKQSFSNSANPSQCKSCGGDKNKLLAELKVLRMMQERVNDDTRDADAHRSALAELNQDLRDKIGSAADRESEVRDATEKLHHQICPDCLDED